MRTSSRKWARFEAPELQALEGSGGESPGVLQELPDRSGKRRRDPGGKPIDLGVRHRGKEIEALGLARRLVAELAVLGRTHEIQRTGRRIEGCHVLEVRRGRKAPARAPQRKLLVVRPT